VQFFRLKEEIQFRRFMSTVVYIHTHTHTHTHTQFTCVDMKKPAINTLHAVTLED
jgi:hypothetical protein